LNRSGRSKKALEIRGGIKLPELQKNGGKGMARDGFEPPTQGFSALFFSKTNADGGICQVKNGVKLIEIKPTTSLLPGD
jgi:hypothetical protein